MINPKPGVRAYLSASVAAATLVAGLLSATPAAAQETAAESAADDTPSPQNDEIVVTARKRSESLQRVPVAVTALSGDQLTAQGVRSPLDLGQYVPSLTVSMFSSQPSGAQFSLRGQAQGDGLLTSSQPVGIYVDSVNVPHPNGLTGSLFDLERIEVLKGPQGTLYGRNTTGGAINIITRGADYEGVHGYALGELGNYDHWKVAGAINVPIIDDVLAIRLAYQHWDRRGFMTSATSGQDYGADHNDDTFRLSIRFNPTPGLTSITKVEYLRQWQNWGIGRKTLYVAPTGVAEAVAEDPTNGAARIAAQVSDPDLFRGYPQTLMFDRLKAWHVSEDIIWDISDNVSLRSISGYHSVDEVYRTDLDATSFQLLEVNALVVGPGGVTRPNQDPLKLLDSDPKYESFTQELNLSGKLFDGKLEWLVGGFYSWERGSGIKSVQSRGALSGALGAAFPTFLPGSGLDATNSSINREVTQTWAIYTQHDFHVTDRFSITGGLRYTEESQTSVVQPYFYNNTTQTYGCGVGFSTFLGPTTTPLTDCGAARGATSSNGVTYLLSANWQITPSILLYGKTARGYRGGALQSRFALAPAVKPEIATDFELGFKADLFDRLLRMNLAVYQTDYVNKQESAIIQTTAGSASILVNAASARIRGFEGELFLNAAPGLTFDASFTYLDGNYKDYPCAIASNPALLGQSNNTACFASGLANPTPNYYIDASGEQFADPKIRFSIGGRYKTDIGPGQLGIDLHYSWVDRQFIPDRLLGFGFTAATGMPALHAALNKPIGLVNGRLDFTLTDPHVTFSLFANNLLNKKYMIAGTSSPAVGFASGFVQEPRMFGASIRWGFGGE